jgi:hypothetical protein
MRPAHRWDRGRIHLTFPAFRAEQEPGPQRQRACPLIRSPETVPFPLPTGSPSRVSADTTPSISDWYWSRASNKVLSRLVSTFPCMVSLIIAFLLNACVCALCEITTRESPSMARAEEGGVAIMRCSLCCSFSPGLASLAGRGHQAWGSDFLALVLCTERPPGAGLAACVVTRPFSAPPPRFWPRCAA